MTHTREAPTAEHATVHGEVHHRVRELSIGVAAAVVTAVLVIAAEGLMRSTAASVAVGALVIAAAVAFARAAIRDVARFRVRLTPHDDGLEVAMMPFSGSRGERTLLPWSAVAVPSPAEMPGDLLVFWSGSGEPAVIPAAGREAEVAAFAETLRTRAMGAEAAELTAKATAERAAADRLGNGLSLMVSAWWVIGTGFVAATDGFETLPLWKRVALPIMAVGLVLVLGRALVRRVRTGRWR